jgi:tryptophan synthase alpha chain
MSRIQATFEQLATSRRKALIPFVTAGDPEPGMTVALMHALVEAGADVIELGVPFSDPMADGPVIQRASDRALKHGVGLDRVLAFVREFRATNKATPVVLMGYANPIEAMGTERFVNEAQTAGVDGVLVVDLPFEEADELRRYTDPAGISFITLVAPTTGEERARKLARRSSGFLYYISVTGVTGTKKPTVGHIEQDVLKLRGMSPVPVAVGFGITTPEQASEVAAFADGVVVGSTLVDLIHRNASEPGGESDIFAFASGLKKALMQISDPV